MYALKRIAAYAIDIAIFWLPMTLLVNFGEGPFEEDLPRRFHMIAMLGSWGLSIAGPVLVNGILTGLTGRSPGKFLMFLRVKDAGGDPPGIAQGILREIIKAVSLGFFFGMIYALQGLVTSGQTFYDNWLDLDVEEIGRASCRERVC